MIFILFFARRASDNARQRWRHEKSKSTRHTGWPMKSWKSRQQSSQEATPPFPLFAIIYVYTHFSLHEIYDLRTLSVVFLSHTAQLSLSLYPLTNIIYTKKKQKKYKIWKPKKYKFKSKFAKHLKWKKKVLKWKSFKQKSSEMWMIANLTRVSQKIFMNFMSFLLRKS